MITGAALADGESGLGLDADRMVATVAAFLFGRVEGEDVGGRDFFGEIPKERLVIFLDGIDALAAGLLHQSADIERRRQWRAGWAHRRQQRRDRRQCHRIDADICGVRSFRLVEIKRGFIFAMR